MLGKVDGVDSDFKTAILRFSDDTFERTGPSVTPGSADAQTQKLANELEDCNERKLTAGHTEVIEVRL